MLDSMLRLFIPIYVEASDYLSDAFMSKFRISMTNGKTKLEIS